MRLAPLLLLTPLLGLPGLALAGPRSDAELATACEAEEAAACSELAWRKIGAVIRACDAGAERACDGLIDDWSSNPTPDGVKGARALTKLGCEAGDQDSCRLAHRPRRGQLSSRWTAIEVGIDADGLVLDSPDSTERFNCEQTPCQGTASYPWAALRDAVDQSAARHPGSTTTYVRVQPEMPTEHVTALLQQLSGAPLLMLTHDQRPQK